MRAKSKGQRAKSKSQRKQEKPNVCYMRLSNDSGSRRIVFWG